MAQHAVKDIAAVGAGRMGRGIAQVFAYAGYPVTLVDLKERPADKRAALFAAARAEIGENLAFLASLGLFDKAGCDTILARISCAGPEEAAEALGKADIIFEGVPETLDAKREALEMVSAHARADAVIASTTSTILVDTLAGLVTQPERFLNAHWLNPAYLIPLVEVSPGEKTDPEVTDRFCAFLESVGKVPVRCKASPGYIVPRIQAIAMNEAARLVEEGVATAEDVDRAVRVGFGPRFAAMGMLEFIDWGGGDILYYAANYLKKELKAERYDPPRIVVRNMEDGATGLTAGRGFYRFDEMDVDAWRREKLARFVTLIRDMDLFKPPALD
jgi:3-hydroxybutyryl-CoA dehydrogenase